MRDINCQKKQCGFCRKLEHCNAFASMVISARDNESIKTDNGLTNIILRMAKEIESLKNRFDNHDEFHLEEHIYGRD